MVEYVDSEAELRENLAFLRDETFENPATVFDAEVRKAACWAWGKRCENRIYAGRHSAFPIERAALDILRPYPNHSDVLGLYVTLLDKHGHKPGHTFALNYEGMRKAGLTDLSRERFREARRALQSAGLLVLVEHHRTGVRGRQYRLAGPLRLFSDDLLSL